MQDSRVGITAHDPSKLGGRVNDDVLGQTGDVNHEERANEEVLGDEVTVGDRLRGKKRVSDA